MQDQNRFDVLLEHVLAFEGRRDDKELMNLVRSFEEAAQNLIAMNNSLQSANQKLLEERARLELRCEMLEMENRRLRRE